MPDEEELLDVELPPSPHGIIWHAPGSRTYFIGTDRGVLYPENAPAVAWNGLVSVDERTSGGELVPFYMDGVRRRNDHFLEEFAATITAFSAPPEFAVCDGELELAPGLYLAQQNREPFGLSYRTYIGDDAGGMTANYELHLVYQAMTEPSTRTHSTLGDSPSAQTISWDIATLPIDVRNAKPSAHVKLDTRRIARDRMDEIEAILYGHEQEARLPEIDELFEILSRIDETVDEEDIPWDPPEVE